MAYEAASAIKPTGLAGISQDAIDQHWKLYEGYVTNTNTLRADLEKLRKDGQGGTALYADRRRRFGFEYNGMVLHEYYFSNLKAGVAQPGDGSALKKALAEQFGSFNAFHDDFVATGTSRSIGWVILYLDPVTGALNNHFIQLHEDGNVASFAPILVMDVWEHAYMVDYGAGGRGAYIKAFMNNVNWQVVEQRFADAKAGKVPKRF